MTTATAGLGLAKDAMIRRLERELNEKTTFVDGLVANAEENERDLNDNEMSMITEYRNRVGNIKQQLDQLEDMSRIAVETTTRAREIDMAISTARGRPVP